jgi:choline-sulfatase
MSTIFPFNILWIQTDEQRIDSLGCYGNHIVKTPHIDRIASEGTLFMNHHVQSPMCVPSRVSELTCCYPHQTGILNNSVHYNWGKWPDGLPAFPEYFANAGYATVNLGKYHTPHHAAWLENWHFEMFGEEASPFQMGPSYDEKEHGVLRYGDQPQSVIISGRYPFREDGRTPQTYLTDHVEQWLSEYPHVRRPFFMRASFLAPHTHVLAPEPYYSMYDPKDMNWDVPSEEILRSRPKFEWNDKKKKNYDKFSDVDFRRMRCTYYGLVSHVDQQVGRIIEKLKQIGEYDNTIIVFTSDHGNLMGEYGQFQKGVFYDITTRVPCIMAGPGIPKGKIVQGYTEAVDLGTTLMAMAGLEAPSHMEGKNMLTQNKDSVIGEVYLGSIRRSWIRTHRWSMDFTSEIKGIPTQTEEERDGKLIDIQNDPLEHNNLYRDPAYAPIITELREQFRQKTGSRRREIQIGKPPVKKSN